MTVVVRDISERRNTEAALAASNQRFALLARATSAVVWDWDLVTNEIWRNEGMTSLFGYPAETIKPNRRWWLRHIHPDDRSRVLDDLNHSLKADLDSWSSQYRFLRADGSTAHVFDRGSVLRGPGNRAIRMVGAMVDISQRVAADEALRASESRYRDLFENATDMVYTRDLEGKLTAVNHLTERLLGYDRGDLVGKNISELVGDDDFQRSRITVEDAAQGGEETDELDFLAKDGTRIPVEVRARLIYEAGKAVAVQGIARDIRERRAAGQALRESEERFRELFENANDMVYTRDIDGTFTAVNHMASRITGYSAEELIGTNISRLGVPEFESVALRTEDAGTEQEFTTDEDEWVRKDGSRVPVEVRARFIYCDGEPVAVQGIARDISDRRQAELILRQSEERFRSLVQNISDVITVVGADSRILYISPSIERLLGYTPAELQGRIGFELVHPGDLTVAQNRLAEALSGDGQISEFRLRHKDGSWIYVEVTGDNQLDNPTVGGFVMNIRDVNERKLAEQTLKASEERYMELFENASDILFTLDAHGNFTSINKAAEQLFGYSREEAMGANAALLMRRGSYEEASQLFQQQIADGKIRPLEVELFARDGRKVALEITMRVIYHDGEPFEVQGIARDVTERKQHEAQLVYLARHDVLTGLPNRTVVEEQLAIAIARARRGTGSALLFLDLDNFKVVNDTLGHAGGDRLLVKLAEAIRSNMREEDTVARVGGDEFTVLLNDVRNEQALIVAEKLRSAISGLRHVESGHVFYPRVSIGVVPITGRKDSAEVLARADLACYAAKSRGRNRVEMHSVRVAELETLSDDARWAVELNEALRGDRFKLLFQPVVRLSDGRLDHHEALVRLQLESGTLQPAGTFIPAAERIGLIQEIDRWVIRHGLAALARAQATASETTLAMNLSGITLRDQSTLAFIWQELESSPIDPNTVIFEITETAVLTDLAETADYINHLRRNGCRFALDDFGSGFSSFSRLAELPVDYVKIDGRFVCDLLVNDTHHAVVRAINDIAHATGKQTVAEFVEDSETLRVLKDMGVDLAQGFYLGKAGRRLRSSRLLPRASAATVTVAPEAAA
jgi:diguanylate cyclase (GGDEF)-like protein/PAS domain S-box-containing protein